MNAFEHGESLSNGMHRVTITAGQLKKSDEIVFVTSNLSKSLIGTTATKAEKVIRG